jgi:hypothetical protein
MSHKRFPFPSSPAPVGVWDVQDTIALHGHYRVKQIWPSLYELTDQQTEDMLRKLSEDHIYIHQPAGTINLSTLNFYAEEFLGSSIPPASARLPKKRNSFKESLISIGVAVFVVAFLTGTMKACSVLATDEMSGFYYIEHPDL